jgi:hypothetical protein
MKNTPTATIRPDSYNVRGTWMKQLSIPAEQDMYNYYEFPETLEPTVREVIMRHADQTYGGPFDLGCELELIGCLDISELMAQRFVDQ